LQLPTGLQYQIRESTRAKRVSIKVSHWGEVEVVVPQGFSQRRIPEILHQRQEWIAKTVQRIRSQRLSSPHAGDVLPAQIELRSIGETWTVTYCQTTEPQIEAQIEVTVTGSHQLTLRGQVGDVAACRQALRRWLSHKAQLHFTPWLQQVSQAIDLAYSRVAVRGQKTRWASCSNRKTISLNYKLLFLPAPLVRYIFVHELCHTVHLNHSPQFWALVAAKEPAYQPLDRALRDGWRYVPEWVERSSE